MVEFYGLKPKLELSFSLGIILHLVLKCQSSLATLSQRNRMTLIWISEHSGVECNGRANDLARKGAANSLPGPKQNLGVTLRYGNRSIADLRLWRSQS